MSSDGAPCSERKAIPPIRQVFVGEIADRFWKFVDKSGGPDACWEWTGNRNSYGYGRYQIRSKAVTKAWQAHRVAFELMTEQDAGRCLDHLCRNKACCNPAHLEAVTIWENTRRGEGLSAQNAVKTHCTKGHPLSGDNVTLVSGRGGKMHRRCVECRNSTQRAFMRRKRDAKLARLEAERKYGFHQNHGRTKHVR